jgi:aldehyde:ferredoxin oxidoreductase
MSKIMRINLSDLKFKIEEMPKEYQGLGRRGLSSNIIISREVPPKTDSFSLENKTQPNGIELC